MTQAKLSILIDTIYKRTGIKAAKKDFETLETTVSKDGKVIKDTSERFKKFGGVMKNVVKEAKRFKMEYLGIMFGGQMIQRTMGGILKSTTTTFLKVMQTAKGASTNIGKLSANFEYLKFTIGSVINQALGPFMPIIIRLLSWVNDWVQQNPGKVFWGIAGAFAAGSALAVGGAFYLFADALGKMITGKSMTELGGLPGILKKIGAEALAHPVITAVALALATIAGLSWAAFNKTPEAWESVKMNVKGLEGPAGRLLETFTELTGITEGLTPNMEDFAWMMGWALSWGINLFGTFLDTITIVAEAMTINTKLIRAFFWALAGNFKKSKAALDETYDSLMRIKDAVVGPLAIPDMPLTVMEYKKQSLREQGFITQTDESGRVTHADIKIDVLNIDKYDGADSQSVIDAMTHKAIQAGGGRYNLPT